MMYFDIHGHNAGLLPFILRAATLFRMPKDRSVKEIISAGLTGGLICAIGDPETYGFRDLKNDTKTVLNQISDIGKSICENGSVIVLSPAELKEIADADRSGFILGIEGGDFIDDEMSAVDAVYKAGVRLIAPMHYSINSLGSIDLGWKGRIIPEGDKTGLTEKGLRFVQKANDNGIIIDLAHADEMTIAEAAGRSRTPVICSHTGPRALTGYGRHITDLSLKLIAQSGGVIGLWPFLNRGEGTIDSDAFKKQALYMRNLIGAEHMAVGTDFNGVPGYMKGYRDITESWKIMNLLSSAGFTDDETEGIAGRNFLRVFNDVDSAKNES
ncbi:MAG: membrane dipeptidase [Spirochaetales bacterium]|uniref:Membrane dipeptidase n=1 Tax=Candidatus Thalassospirochaeta sargassi TaxID=3119039 RepID=A0AAJ1MMM5_9SPIO|nr:membrane dipeptidase [Spirochaetales bacterium]